MRFKAANAVQQAKHLTQRGSHKGLNMVVDYMQTLESIRERYFQRPVTVFTLDSPPYSLHPRPEATQIYSTRIGISCTKSARCSRRRGARLGRMLNGPAAAAPVDPAAFYAAHAAARNALAATSMRLNPPSHEERFAWLQVPPARQAPLTPAAAALPPPPLRE